MSILLEAVAQRIEENNLGKRGVDLFINGMPASVHEGIGLVPPRSGNDIDHELPGYRKTTFQIVVRGRNYLEGMEKINALTNLIFLNQSTILGNLEVRYIRPRHDPIAYPLSDAGLTEFSVNFDANYVIVQQ